MDPELISYNKYVEVLTGVAYFNNDIGIIICCWLSFQYLHAVFTLFSFYIPTSFFPYTPLPPTLSSFLPRHSLRRERCTVLLWITSALLYTTKLHTTQWYKPSNAHIAIYLHIPRCTLSAHIKIIYSTQSHIQVCQTARAIQSAYDINPKTEALAGQTVWCHVNFYCSNATGIDLILWQSTMLDLHESILWCHDTSF